MLSDGSAKGIFICTVLGLSLRLTAMNKLLKKVERSRSSLCKCHLGKVLKQAPQTFSTENFPR